MKDHLTNSYVDRANSDGPPHDVRADAVGQLARRALACLCAGTDSTKPQAQPSEAEHIPGIFGDPIASALAYALCDVDPDVAQSIIDELLDAGVSVEDVCLNHLAPAARRLGEWWTDDRVPFTDVTLATARLQSMMLRMPACRAAPAFGDGRGAMFAAVPGEQHTLGVMMAADLFRRHGWDVGLLVGMEHGELVARISRDDRPVIGLSCSGDHSYPALRRLMSAIRRNRPNAHVLLSGQIIANAVRLTDLPGPFTVVSDTAHAEGLMAELDRDLAADAAMARAPQRSEA